MNYPKLPQSMIGTRIDTIMHMSDWYPTFCIMAGITPDDGYHAAHIDGVNVWPILSGQTTVSCCLARSRRDVQVPYCCPPRLFYALSHRLQDRPASMWHAQGGPGVNELMLGVGGGSAGAYINGTKKIIIGGQEAHTDGWSAQYYGTTPTLPPPANEACKDEACLFDVAADQREVRSMGEI